MGNHFDFHPLNGFGHQLLRLWLKFMQRSLARFRLHNLIDFRFAQLWLKSINILRNEIESVNAFNAKQTARHEIAAAHSDRSTQNSFSFKSHFTCILNRETQTSSMSRSRCADEVKEYWLNTTKFVTKWLGFRCFPRFYYQQIFVLIDESKHFGRAEEFLETWVELARTFSCSDWIEIWRVVHVDGECASQRLYAIVGMVAGT